MGIVEQLLKEGGPCLSTELARLLVDQHNLSPEAARQRISRQVAPVKRLAYLKFPRNARFMYLQDQYGSPWFWDGLEKALRENSPAYGGAIAALRQRGDLMPKSHFFIACGSPLAQQRHLSPQMILDRLTQAKLFEEFDVPGIGPCITRAQEAEFYSDMIPEMRARLVVEDIMLKAVRGWARSLGVISYDKAKIRDDDSSLPQVGTFAWDLSAPSYLGALIERSDQGKPSPGFFVCDILLDREITVAGIEPFLRKCQTLRNLKRIGRCLQLFIADRYSKEAFQLAKSQGIMPGTSETLFGKEVAASLRQLSEVLQQAAGLKDVKIFDKLFNNLSRIEGAATNLRGALFEFWAAEAVRQTFSAHIRMNRIFIDGADKAEVDVQASVASRQIRFYECKGYQPGGLIPDDEVDRWLDKRIPLVYKQAREASEWTGKDFHFEFWTTGRLSEASITRIKKAQANIRTGRYTLDFYDSERLMAVARDTKDKVLIDALRQHFLNHPMAKIQRTGEKFQRSESGIL